MNLMERIGPIINVTLPSELYPVENSNTNITSVHTDQPSILLLKRAFRVWIPYILVKKCFYTSMFK